MTEEQNEKKSGAASEAPAHERVVMNQFDKRKGTFKPVRSDDLAPGVAECVGMYCIWEAMWIIEEGQFEGQWAMAPRIDVVDTPNVPFAWVPECDIDFDS